MTAIYKRELKSYFQTMTGWVFLAVSIFITSLYFVSANLTFGQSDFSYTLNSVVFMFIFTIPVLTMKVISEERKQKTDQLIFTSPVSVWRIITAKYLAMLTVFSIAVLFFALFPLIMSSFGEVALTESYSALLGFFFLGAACIAYGLFISSLTESLVVSAILTIAALFVAYQVDGIAYMISAEGNLFTDILHVFDLTGYYSRISGGKLDLKAVIYFISVIYICIFLTVQIIRKRSYTVSRRGMAPGAYSLSVTAMTVAAAVFVNLAAAALPEKYTSVDMTSNKLYSLTDVSKTMLSGLDKDINIYVLNSENDEDELLGETLDKMEEASPHIKVAYRDPVEYPDFYKDYTDGNISFNSLIVVCGDKYKVIDYSDCYTYSFDYSTFSSSADGYDGEGRIISAIDYVTRDSLPVIYTLKGHGERELGSEFKAALSKANIETEELNLIEYDSVPDDAKAIYIASPESDLTADDMEKLDAYIKKGGKIIADTLFVNNFEEEMPNLSRIFAEFGVSIEDGLVFESSRENYFQHQTWLLPETVSDDLTEGVYDESYVFMPTAQSIAADEESEDCSITTFLKTAGEAYLKDMTQYENSALEGPEKLDSDKEGPFNLGVRSVKTMGDEEAELVLVSSANFFTDEANAMTSGGNLKIFTNTAAQFTDMQSNISVSVKKLRGEYLMVNQGTKFQLTVILTALIPVLLLGSGFAVMLKRKKR